MEVVKERILPAQRAGLKIYAQSCQNSNKGSSVVVEDQKEGDQLSLEIAAARNSQAKLVKALREGGYLDVAEVVAQCGTKPLPKRLSVDIRSSGTGRHLSGLCHCKSMLCPLCAKYYAAKRSEKLHVRGAELVKHVVGECDCKNRVSSLDRQSLCLLDGKPIFLQGAQMFHMVTTLRHHKGAKFRVLVDALRKVQSKMQQQRFWKEAVLGNVRSLEVTYGVHGFHPHNHNLLVLCPLVDAVAFSARVESFWSRELKKLDRTCEWQPGWFSRVEGDKVETLICYMAKAIEEVSLSANKVKVPWALPVDAYVEIYKTGRGLRWFSTGGVWKSKETNSAESEDELEAERESDAPVVLSIPVVAWNKLSIEDKLLIRAIVADKVISDDDCILLVLRICYSQLK